MIIAFHLTRHFAIAHPTAGPIFYQPDYFSIEGTASAEFVILLKAFMAGDLHQPPAFLPGTQAFPSLHVGLTWCGMVLLWRTWPRSLWLTIPWFILNWLSTVFLGWHYIIDGVGGVAVMAFSLWCSSKLMTAFGKPEKE